MVRRKLLILFGLLVLVGATNASTARRKAFVPRQSHPALKKSIEIPRGGALVEKTSVAKVATAVSLLQGAVACLNPASACQGYGIVTSPIAELIMRRLGVVLIQMGILGSCLFFNTCGVNTAIGAASLGFMVEITRSLLNNEHKTIGFGLVPQLVVFLECFIVAYVNLSNQECANTVNKVNAVWIMTNGLLFALLPSWVLKFGWGMSIVDTRTIGMVSGFGFWCVAYAIYVVCLAWDMEAIKALTWSRLLILLIHLIPSRGESIGMNKSKQMVLFAYQAIIFAALVAQDGIRCLVRCSV